MRASIPYFNNADSEIFSGGGNAHTCPFCRQGLIPKWPEKNEAPDQDEDDDPSGDHVPLNLPLRWVPKWYVNPASFLPLMCSRLSSASYPLSK